MEFILVHCAVVAALARCLPLVKRHGTRVARHSSAALIVNARPLCAVWQFDPQNRRLEMRWTAEQARP